MYVGGGVKKSGPCLCYTPNAETWARNKLPKYSTSLRRRGRLVRLLPEPVSGGE